MELKNMKQETEKVEVNYERIQKLAHGLQLSTIDNFLTTMFKMGLQSYFKIATVRMKRSTLQQHKEAAMLCEKGMITTKTRNALLIPQSIKHVIQVKTQSNIGYNKHCTNYGMTNHNVETYRKKKEQTTVATTEVAQPSQKTQKTSSYECHIYGLTDCPKFAEMQKMFHGKFMVVIKVQLVAKT